MGVLQLTPQEIDRFSAWLEQDAASNEQLAKQMDIVPGSAPVAKKYRTEAMAELIVAAMLKRYERDSISAG